jgi:hypothetical protein
MKNLNYIILFSVTFLVFGNTISNDYNLDDHLVNNIRANSIEDIFTTTYSQENGFNYGYRPISILTFYIEYSSFGKNSRISHTINLLLYIMLNVLIFKLLKRIFKSTDRYILLFITLLFVVHPIHTEVVASIKNRDEILSLLFIVSASLLVYRWVSNYKWYSLLMIVTFCSLSILSKRSSLPIHFLIPLIVILKEEIKLKPLVILLLCVGLPISIFAFNFILIKGIILFCLIFCFSIGVYYLKDFLSNKKIQLPSVLVIFLSVILIGVLISGIILNTIYPVLFGFLVVLYLAGSNEKKYLLGTLIISIIGFFISNNSDFLVLSVCLISFFLVYRYKGFRQSIPFLLLLAFYLSLISIHKAEPFSFVLYLIPISIFLTARINKYVPFILATILVATILGTGSLGVFHTSVFLLALLFLESKYQLIYGQIVFIALIVCLSALSGLNQYNYDQIAVVELVPDKLIEERSELPVGRNLEFVENTLVAKHTLEERFATGLLTMGTYLGLMVYPKELSFYYGYSKINTTNFKDYKVWISLFSYLLLFYCAIYFFKKQPLISIGAIWFISCILLFSNLPVLVAGMVGERLAFSGSLGFCMMIGGVINWINPQFSYKKIRGLEALSILLLLAFSLRTFARNEKWESTTVLMSNDIEHLENSAQANYLLGVHSIKKTLKNYKGSISDIQEIQQSIKYFKRAVEIEPKHYDFHLSLAKAYLSLDENYLAKRSLEYSYALAPKALISLFELAKINFMLKEYKQAISYSSLYLEQSTNNHLIYEMAAFGAYYLDDYELSISYAKEGLNQFPQNEKLNELFFDLQRRMP